MPASTEKCRYRDDAPEQSAPSNAAPVMPEPAAAVSVPTPQPPPQTAMSAPAIAASSDLTMANGGVDASVNGNQPYGNNENEGGDDYHDDNNYGPIGIMEDV